MIDMSILDHSMFIWGYPVSLVRVSRPEHPPCRGFAISLS